MPNAKHRPPEISRNRYLRKPARRSALIDSDSGQLPATVIGNYITDHATDDGAAYGRAEITAGDECAAKGADTGPDSRVTRLALGHAAATGQRTDQRGTDQNGADRAREMRDLRDPSLFGLFGFHGA